MCSSSGILRAFDQREALEWRKFHLNVGKAFFPFLKRVAEPLLEQDAECPCLEMFKPSWPPFPASCSRKPALAGLGLGDVQRSLPTAMVL